MCGIIGYIGKDNFFDYAKQGLKNLEYRGYDSAGLAYFDKNRIKAVKSIGDVDKLFKKVDFSEKIDCGIGHTRWATHGKPSLCNCHPQCSQHKIFYVVHNGIIENYNEIKQKILENFSFKSETDTEVISNLIEYFYKQEKNVLEAIKKATSLLKGNYALAILFKEEKNKIYFARKDSPLIVGKNKKETFISSDLVGFGDSSNKYMIVDNNCFGYISPSGIKKYNSFGNIIKNDFKKQGELAFRFGKGNYDYYMLKEIYEIPLAVKETIKMYDKPNNPLCNIPTRILSQAKQIIIIACGTSYHAGLIGEKYIKEICNKDCKTFIASEFIYNKEIINKNTLCIFISQSGETADTLSAVKKAKEHSAKTIAITNVLTSAITRLCDYTLPICAGPEIGVASTKAYNAQIALLLMIASYMKDIDTFTQELNELKKFADDISPENINADILPLVNLLNNANNIYFVGRDYDYITCLEACLKIKEISYIPCEAYPAGELKHGTLALITNNVPVIAVITEEHLIDKTMAIINQVKARGGKVYIFTCFDLVNYNTKNFKVINLKKYQTWISPIANIIYFQLLAYNMTLSLNYNPDRPRNLAKSVTVE